MKIKTKRPKGFIVKHPSQSAEWVFVMPNSSPDMAEQNVFVRMISKLRTK